MTIPKGFPDERKFYRLKKAIYGLRQASLAWIMEFETFMKENKFLNLKVDICLYRSDKLNDKEIIYVHYVDDILIASSSSANIERFKLNVK